MGGLGDLLFFVYLLFVCLCVVVIVFSDTVNTSSLLNQRVSRNRLTVPVIETSLHRKPPSSTSERSTHRPPFDPSRSNYSHY